MNTEDIQEQNIPFLTSRIKFSMWSENKDSFFFFEVLLVVFGELISIWGPLVYSFF